jgi:hypothetical protein
MTKQEPWFIEERAFAFASLMLTACRDVVVHAHAGTDMAIDLLVEIRKKGKPPRPFGVQMVGYMDLPDIRHAEERVLSHRADSLPICVFVIGARKPEGVYRWIVEPVIEDGQAQLRQAAEPHWQVLDEAGAARLIDQVNVWYDARKSDFAPKGRGRQAKADS